MPSTQHVICHPLKVSISLHIRFSQELCARCLKYNRSCGRAWELLGSVAEREQAYKDAASHYESAWKCCGSGDAQVGFAHPCSLLLQHVTAGTQPG